ncbi:hypothetical protein BC833DRAFT_600096 [Globomyces pollinis-pini]|nr:hypothetical protein BC833DRAFT_600096 [Globomyces pollinis-pini]
MTLIIHLPVELLEHISRYLDIKQYHHFRISFQNLLNIRVRLNWDMFIESLEIVEELIPEMYLTTFIQFINSNRLDILCEFDFQHLILNRLIHYG